MLRELPRTVRNRLHLGRSVAARLASERAGVEQWVLVRPVVEPDCPVIHPEGAEGRVEPGDGTAIIGYLVVEVEQVNVSIPLRRRRSSGCACAGAESWTPRACSW